jgi:diguanylate cyclase (GGDEF)-like protein/PAS domain S-box-containing protein
MRKLAQAFCVRHRRYRYYVPMTLAPGNRTRFAWVNTLKFKIVVMAAVTGVLSAVVTAELLLSATEKNIQSVLMQADSDDVQRTAELLASKLDVLQNTLGAVARQVRPQMWNQPDAMAEYLADQSALGVLFDNVLAARASGEMIARVVKGQSTAELPNIADRAYFQQSLKTDQPVVSDPLIGKVNKTPIVIISIPVLGREGTVTGVVAGSLRLQSTSLFSSVTYLAREVNGRTLVMNRAGVLLAHTDSTRVMGRAADEAGLTTAYKRWSDMGSPIDTEGSSTLEDGHLVTMAGIPVSDWVLVRLTPQAVALQPLHAARDAAWRVALGVGLLAAALAAALAWYLTLPISRLQARAEKMLSETGTSNAVWPQGGGEIGALALAFQKVVELRQEKQIETQALLVQLEAVLDHAQVGITLTRNGRFELVSQNFCHIFRFEKHQAIGQLTSIIHVSEEAYQALSVRALPAFMQNGAFDGEVELMRHTGQLFWAHMRGRAVVPGDRSQGTIWTVEDVTEAREQRERLSWTSSHDSLTGLANRPAFEALLERATQSAGTEPFCAMFIDLDHFKQVNDTGGHAAGDALLRDVAQVLATTVRQTDTVARLGGDEFAVLLSRCPLPKAVDLADKLCTAVVDYRLAWEGQSFGVGASIGLVRVDGSFTTAADVLRAADAACYTAKQGGRNRVALFDAQTTAPHPELS